MDDITPLLDASAALHGAFARLGMNPPKVLISLGDFGTLAQAEARHRGATREEAHATVDRGRLDLNGVRYEVDPAL